MATTEKVGLLTHVDEHGNQTLLYPVTTMEAVEGLEETVDTIRGVISKFHSNIQETASGEVITVADASDLPLAGLKVFGKTEQNGTPTPEAPVPLESVGDVTVAVAGENVESQTIPIIGYGLPGIPVTSGGNYTDSTGRQWICDEVDFEKGVYVQRVVDIEANGADEHSYQALNGYFRIAYTGLIDRGAGLCNIGKVYTSFSGEGICYNPDYVYFRFDSLGVNSTQMTVADMKVWLSEHPIKLKAILATEKTYELSADQLAAFAALHSNYPNTTVFNDRDAGMEVKYVADTKLYIDQKFNELAAALVSNV